MSDLEQRLSQALADGAQDAPAARGLADAARTRARARRRNRLVGAAAVVALGVGVPVVVVAAQGSDQRTPQPGAATQHVAKDPAASGPQLPGGYHYESWHDVSVAVPDAWSYGSQSDWCASDGSLDTPRIERPGTVHLDILCSPGSGYGISFQEVDDTGDFVWPLTQQDPDSWPVDAYVGAHGVGGVLVQVALPDLEQAQQVLASVEQNTVLDPNGCPVDVGSDPAVPAGSMSVCRYDVGGKLEQSELLRGDDVTAAETALKAAPVDSRKGPDCEEPAAPQKTVIKMASLATNATVTFGDCWQDDRVGFSPGGTPHRLTEEILYWALSPGWSGSVPGGVSLPSVLRTR